MLILTSRVRCWCCRDHRVHIIHFSTDWAYDGADAHSVETNPNTHGFGVYGQTKLGGEQAIQSIQPSKGVTWTILRSALMYGAPSPLTGKHSFLKVRWMVIALERSLICVRCSLLLYEFNFFVRSQFMIDGLRSEEGISLFSDEYRTPVPVPFILSVLRRIIHDVTSPAASAAASSDAETNSSSNSSCSSSSVWTNQIFNMGGPERMSRHAMGEILCRVLSAPLSRCRPITLEEAGLAQARPGDLSMNSEKLYGAMRGVRPGRFEEEFRKLGL